MPHVEKADFDSNLFGFDVGRIELEETAPSAVSSGVVLEGLLREAYTRGIKLVYLFRPAVYYDESGSPVKNSEVLSLTGSPAAGQRPPGILVDTKTTFTTPLSSFDAADLVQKSFLQSSNGIQIQMHPKGPDAMTPSIRDLAIASGEWSRFKVDMNIPRHVFETMFESWIRNSLNLSIADEIFVAKDTATGADAGFITVKKKGDVVHIGLLAVSSKFRRMGIASRLLSRAALWSIESGAKTLSVVTQGANEVACSCYRHFGFKLSVEQEVYHLWLPQHLEEPLLRADQAPIQFCKQFFTGKEKQYVSEVFATGLDSASRFTVMCASRIKEILGTHCERVVMVPSGTAALEMAALLAGLKAGDEIIMPSYTFSSTANAFVLRGVVPVFIDIRADTLNMDETLIEQAITPQTRAICAVHYGGVPCEMDTICAIAQKHNLILIEDAAQGFLSTYKGRPVGTFGHFGCFSFHYTKNIICGEGGAISINRDPELARRALVLWEKGTNRYDFMAGKIDKYEWIDLGSSYVPNEVSSAILWAQLEHGTEITTARLANYHAYLEGLRDLHDKGVIRIPTIPEGCVVNGHIFFLLLSSEQLRHHFAEELKRKGVTAFSHYVPLHSSPAGKKYGRTSGTMTVTDSVAAGLLRLPVWVGLRGDDLQHVIHAVRSIAQNMITA